MKRIIFFLCLCFLIPSSCITVNNNGRDAANTKTEATTFILVRHAEKSKEGKDPNLTREGQERAENLSRMLRDVSIDAIYSSNYQRTMETAKPTANNKNLPVQSYNPRELPTAMEEMLAAHKGGTILVVGHSNSTPTFVNLLAGEEAAQAIDETEYDNLYFVSYYGPDNAAVMQLRF